jgi:hypothetical protein
MRRASTWTANGGPGLVSSSRAIPNVGASVVAGVRAETDWGGEELGTALGVSVGTLVDTSGAVADGTTVGVGVPVGATAGSGV